MRINVKLGEPLWRSAGRRRLVLEWPAEATVTVTAALARLGAEHKDFETAYRAYRYRLFVDGAQVDLANSTSFQELRDGQTLFILLPAIGGGTAWRRYPS